MAPGRKRSRAEEIQLEIFRRMTPQERLECCFRWTALTYEFARSAIRKEHPDWIARQVDREIGRRITGIDVEQLPGFGSTAPLRSVPSLRSARRRKVM